MKKSVVPFVSVVAFAVIASNSVHAAGVNQDDLALIALNKLKIQSVSLSAATAVPAQLMQAQSHKAHVLNEKVIGKSQVKAIIAQELNYSLNITISDLLGSDPIKLIGSDPIYSNATAMLTD